MCLYALEEYRDWALRLASPLLLPLARQAFETLSKNRQAISRWISARSSEKDIAAELGRVELDSCSAVSPVPSAGRTDLGNKVSDYLR
jgi:hypothetical protein